MNKLNKILSISLGGVILFATTTLARTGTVNAPNGLVLRETASKSGNPITTISDDAKVEILEQSGEWYQVKYNNQEGYLFAEYVEAEKQEEPKKEDEPKASEGEQKEDDTSENKNDPKEENVPNSEKKYPKKEKVKSDLKIYTIPSVTATTIANAKKDEELTINYELNNWVNVTYGKTTGWARKYFVNEEAEKPATDKKEENKPEEIDKKENTDNKNVAKPIDNKKGYVDVSNSANIRKEASTSSDIINTLLRNTEVILVAEEGDFYKIKYQDITGYISKSLISDKPVAEVTSRGSSERKPSQTSNNTTSTENKTPNKETTEKTDNKEATSNSSAGSNVVSYAKQYIGYSYTLGGTKPSTGFDCSGFVYYVFNSCGYSLSRSCQVQAKSGSAVSRQNLVAGDLVFFNNGSGGSIGHVGIYIGGGQFVHAENSRTGVRTDTINSGYYNKYYYSARRIIK